MSEYTLTSQNKSVAIRLNLCWCAMCAHTRCHDNTARVAMTTRIVTVLNSH